MKQSFKQGKAKIAFKLDGYYLWDASVIKVDNLYYLFCSRWPKSLGFGWNWLFHSQVILAVSDKPEGPYKFRKVLFERRGADYFDGMNTHNPCIKYFNNKFYLYYMGCTYNFDPPKDFSEITQDKITKTWFSKRIGLATSDKIDGEYVRKDMPLLDPRDNKHWDSGITTNPTVVIKNNGETFLLYKSKRKQSSLSDDEPLKLGVAYSSNPSGPFERLTDEPILNAPGTAYEDPYIWYDDRRNIFCALIKDCVGNVAEEYGNLFYAESKDCKSFTLSNNPTTIRRDVVWDDGHKTKQCNLERPCVLLDSNNRPEYLFCASGDGTRPYYFENETYILCIKLEDK